MNDKQWKKDLKKMQDDIEYQKEQLKLAEENFECGLGINLID